MKKLLMCLITVFIFSVGTIGFLTSEAGANQTSNVTLTKEQKQEMSVLHKKAIEQKKEIINKYVEYGVLSKEKGEKINAHLDERYQKLEKNGFIPKCDREHCKMKNKE